MKVPRCSSLVPPLPELICGIDVSKDVLDLCYNMPGGKLRSFRIENNHNGHVGIVKKLGSERLYVMESSGPYHLSLAYSLHAAGAQVRIENPLTIRRFIQMNGERSKTDKKDAHWLYRYGMERKRRKDIPPSHDDLMYRQIIAASEMFIRQRTMLSNHLRAISVMPVECAAVVDSLNAVRKDLDNRIIALNTLLQEALELRHSGLMRSVESIPGLGKRATAFLIVYTNGFENITNHRKLIALAGLAPREFTSGSSVRGKLGISKGGNRRLRSVLYMCSLSAIRHNKACKELFERKKAQGKPGKAALIAVCNKLLKQAFAVAKSGELYNENLVGKKQI